MSHEPQSSFAAPEAEPTVTPTNVPMWLIVGTLVLLFLTAWYFDLRGGWFAPKVYAPYMSEAHLAQFWPPPPNEAWRPRGEKLFRENCALCHNTDGSGKPGQAPALAGSEWVVTAGVNRLTRIPQVGLVGPIKVKGQDWNLNMLAAGSFYSDEQMADVLSYIRNSRRNHGRKCGPTSAVARSLTP